MPSPAAESVRPRATATRIGSPRPGRQLVERLPSRLRRPLRRAAHSLETTSALLAKSWRRSLQLRVLASMLSVTLVVVIVLGTSMTSLLSQRLLNSKYETGLDELERARVAVEAQIDASDPSSTVRTRLNSARSALSNGGFIGDEGTLGMYLPVLIAPAGIGDETVIVPESAQIPDSLRSFVDQGQVSYQHHEVETTQGLTKALILGTPTATSIEGLQLYLVLPLDGEERTLRDISGVLIFSVGGLSFLILIILWWFSQRVIVPVRQASRIAERFSSGHLRERMAVQGEDDMARLAMSFNEMAESLSKQIASLEDYGNLQRQFTSDVSHELRTPITTVRMAADLIADNAEDLDPSSRRAVELMMTQLDRFESLLNDLLEISRHDAGVVELSTERVDLRGSVRQALQTVEHLQDEVGATVELDMPAEPVLVDMDSRRIERVLRNLLANALDHAEGHPVELTLRASDTTAALVVRDRGVGLKPGQDKLVFNRFWRADTSRKRHSGGTGLGLAISKEDVLLHGGTISAWGEPGRGAAFRVVLPLNQDGLPLGESPLSLIPLDELTAGKYVPLPSADQPTPEVDT